MEDTKIKQGFGELNAIAEGMLTDKSRCGHCPFLHLKVVCGRYINYECVHKFNVGGYKRNINVFMESKTRPKDCPIRWRF